MTSVEHLFSCLFNSTNVQWWSYIAFFLPHFYIKWKLFLFNVTCYVMIVKTIVSVVWYIQLLKGRALLIFIQRNGNGKVFVDDTSYNFHPFSIYPLMYVYRYIEAKNNPSHHSWYTFDDMLYFLIIISLLILFCTTYICSDWFYSR